MWEKIRKLFYVLATFSIKHEFYAYHWVVKSWRSNKNSENIYIKMIQELYY